jgi:hypothetical protein
MPMTTDSDFKTLVRARMAQTGQPYTAARAQIMAERTAAPDQHRPNPAVAPEADPQRTADDAYYAKTVRSFFVGDRLRAIPAKRKARVVVLLEVLRRFEAGRTYTEPEVNALLRQAHDDVAFLRRELVDYRYLERADGSYWVTTQAPVRDANEAQEVPASEADLLAAMRQD